MREIKRYYANWGLKAAEYYKKRLDKERNENQKNEKNLRGEIEKKDRHIKFLTIQNEGLRNEMNRWNDEYLLLLDDVRSFLQRHPEMNDEWKRMKK